MSKRVDHQPRRRSFVIVASSILTGETKCFQAMSIRQAMRFLGVGQSIVYGLLTSVDAKVIGSYIVTAYDNIDHEELLLQIPDKALEKGGFEC